MEALCGAMAVYRYTWPGKDEDVICEDCSRQLSAVANAMGLHLQLVPLCNLDRTCPKRKKKD